MDKTTGIKYLIMGLSDAYKDVQNLATIDFRIKTIKISIMGEFFGSIYCWFEDVFGLELANYLWGNVSPDQQANMYVPIGFTMLGATLVVCLLYYYIIDHPRMAKWWGWLVFWGANAVVNFLVGWQWVLRHYYLGYMIGIDPSTKKNMTLISLMEICCVSVLPICY